MLVVLKTASVAMGKGGSWRDIQLISEVENKLNQLININWKIWSVQQQKNNNLLGYTADLWSGKKLNQLININWKRWCVQQKQLTICWDIQLISVVENSINQNQWKRWSVKKKFPNISFDKINWNKLINSTNYR